MIRHLGRGMIGAFALCAVLAGPVSARADTITVFAAASLKTALDQIADQFTKDTGDDLRLSLAGSSVLARQIQLGAPADVFISANPGWMDLLQAEGLLYDETRFDMIANQLVVIAPVDNPTPVDLSKPGAVAERLTDGPLAMGLVSAVPAGIYGKEAMESLGHWAEVAPKVAQTDNVRAALALVSAGEVPLGVVYASDVRADPDVVVVAEVPDTAHSPILYAAAALQGGNRAVASEFLDYLRRPNSQSILTRQGFLPLGE
ncbi:molybdate ABC transporter substrate-binding protein [uncultured Shimia sp.]|uniref:molybdate ABC transporter substrate-binding protein n=1 Tax=uncultured Shimia sp. TaxID=573152 RepID=UPI002615D6F8|nr:molybdate ABC transporter substrate-binding protein [uncultured Shimia sp.]